MEYHQATHRVGKIFSLLVFVLSATGAWALSFDLALAATWNVSITSTGFVPQIVSIQPGDTIIWTNNDLTLPHRNVGSDPHTTHTDYPALDLDDIAQLDTAQITISDVSCKRIGYHDHEKDEDVGAIFVGGPCPAREPDKPTFWGIYVTKITPSSALIEWSTERGSYTQLAYSTNSGIYDVTTSADDMLTKFHRAEITDLTASTTYYFHAVGGMGMDQKFPSEEHKFTTLMPTPAVVEQNPEPSTVSVIATATPIATTTMPMMNMHDMPGMENKHTGMGVSAYAIRTVHTLKFPVDLRQGSRDESVRALQEWLITKKLLASGLNTGYFGMRTKAALVNYQKNMGLPQTGYFGPLTRQMIDDMGE